MKTSITYSASSLCKTEHDRHLEYVTGKIFAVVDASIHRDEVFQRRLLFDAAVVQARVQHYHRKGQDVARICNTHNTLCRHLS